MARLNFDHRHPAMVKAYDAYPFFARRRRRSSRIELIVAKQIKSIFSLQRRC